MYKLFLTLCVGLLSAQQTCKLSFSNSYLSESGEILFTIKNITSKKVKAPKLYSDVWARPINMQIYNDEAKEYQDTKYIADDVDCFDANGCFGKMINIKSGNSKEYKVKIISSRISRAFKEKGKYRFKLAFDTHFSGCKDYETDWHYYQN